MQIRYDDLSLGELSGDTLADYLVSIEAHLSVEDDQVMVYDEPSFPVVELARSLNGWLSSDSPENFEFTSMSWEETGAVSIRQAPAGWFITSVFTGRRTSPTTMEQIEFCCRRFIRRVESDLHGRGLDPELLLEGERKAVRRTGEPPSAPSTASPTFCASSTDDGSSDARRATR